MQADLKHYTVREIAEGFVYNELEGKGLFGLARREVLSFSHHVEVASLPPEQQDEWLAKAETENLTRNELRTAIHRAKDHQARDIEFGGDDAKSERWEILAGDFKERMLDIPAGTVDLILTDPPYPEEFADLWTDLAIEAARALRPGGILAAMSGKIHLDDRMRRLGEYLSYGWIYVQPLPGSNTRILGRHIYQWSGSSRRSEPMREALRRFKTPVRWMPDLIAVRDEILFVDAKSEQRRDTPNFSVECASWESDKRWSIALAAPVVYVFADFSANYIDALRPIRTISEDRGGTSGSGTAFILVRKSDQLHLEEIFGRVE